MIKLRCWTSNENSKKFKLTKDVGFGNTYEKSLWYDFKPYGVVLLIRMMATPQG